MKITQAVADTKIRPMVKKVMDYLDQSSKDDVFLTEELAKALGISCDRLQHRPFNGTEFQTYRVRALTNGAFRTYWGSKIAIQKFKKLLGTTQKP